MSPNPPRTALRQPGTATSAIPASSGSQTITNSDASPIVPTLRLRGHHQQAERRHIQWAEGVVDNEGMGKKSSKVCCIYHKPKEPGDSESEDSSSSDSDSDSEPDLSRARKAGGSKGKRGRHSHDDDDGGEGGAGDAGKERKASPNAYERQPKMKGKKEG